MRVTIGMEIRGIYSIRGPFLDARRTFSFASPATLSACLDLTRRGPARWLARGVVRPA